MFTNTAYEAMYEYLGLSMHSRFMEIITSESFFKGLIVLIFGVLFFITSLKFFSRYLPSTLIKKQFVPASRYVKIILCLVLGVSLLKVDTTAEVFNYKGDSWFANFYIQKKVHNVKPEYKVSFAFDLLSRTAEEITALTSRIIDQLFMKYHSQLEAPNFFFKSIMYAGSATIKDPKLKNKINFYTEECFEKLIPLIGSKTRLNKLDSFFRGASAIDKYLEDQILDSNSGMFSNYRYTCLDLKNEIRLELIQYTNIEVSFLNRIINSESLISNNLDIHTIENLQMSNMLVNHYIGQKEDFLGIKREAKVPGGASKVFQYLNRIFSFDGFLSILGLNDYHGSSMAAKRSQEFSEHLTRAPHLAGFIKMILIAAFPWLVFFVVAGKWRVLIYWFLIYFSVLLWTPIWTLLYHIMTSIANSAELMEAFGQLYSGISLYSAKVVNARIYYLYAVYSWIQVFIGPIFTALLVYMIKPMLTDTQSEHAPEFIGDSGKVAGAGAKIAGAF